MANCATLPTSGWTRPTLTRNIRSIRRQTNANWGSSSRKPSAHCPWNLLACAAKCIHYTHLREPDRFARPRACRKPMAFFARKLRTHTHTHTHTQLCNLPCMQRNEIVAGWQQQQQQHAGHCMVMATAGGRSTMLHKDVHARAWVSQNKQQQND